MLDAHLRHLALLALPALLLVTACPRRVPIPDPTPATGEWYETQADEGFSFSMPDPPEVQRQNVPTEAGPLPIVMYLLADDARGAAYNVTSARYPEGFMDTRDPAEVLAGARDGAASNISGEILEQRDLQLFAPDGSIAPGLELVMRTPQEMLYRGRIFVVGPQLIQLSYVTTEKGGSEEAYRHFVESFILTPSSPAAPSPDDGPTEE
ncbi:MAG: hypothetical protein P1V51_01375 [Deltaproteobacteria bacterium]|nr:hypothetical protein [Deltaproteobacteria bacterium]